MYFYLRDVPANEIPIVFVKELCVTASFLGTAIFYLLLMVIDPTVFANGWLVSGAIIRLPAIRYGWSLPGLRTYVWGTMKIVSFT